MIGKQVKGRGFRGVLNYLEENETSKLIGGNMAGENARTLSAEFAVSRRMNPELEKAVYHSSLSLPQGETLDDETWSKLAEDYLTEMGFSGSQFVVYRHSDREHDHIHLVASRIKISDGTTVSDSWDYVRSEKAIRELENRYDLTPTVSSRRKEQRGKTSGELRLIERTGEESVKEKLQRIINQQTEKPIAMPEFVDRLKAKGIDAHVSFTRTGKIKGISYEVDGVATSGTKLGKAYTFPGLQRYRKVSYQESEREELVRASEKKVFKKEELVLSLANQIQYQREINEKLRRVPGRLALLVRNDEARVVAIEANKSKSEQEKLIIKKNGEKWEVMKNELNYEQQNSLMRVLDTEFKIEDREARKVKHKRKSR